MPPSKRSRVDKSESEENEIEASTIVISESNSEEESKSKEEEDNITQANEYLDQDLIELGPDRLDREETDESDIKKEVSEEFKTSKYFRQLIIDLEGNLSLPSKEVNIMLTLLKTYLRTSTSSKIINSFFILRPSSFTPKLVLPLSDDSDNIFTDESSDESSDEEFDQIVEEELRAEDKSIKLDNLNNIEFIDNRRSELLLDSLIGDLVTLEQNTTLRTYREVLTTVKEELSNKQVNLLPRIRFEYSLIQQYVQNLLKKSPRRGRIEASLLVAESNHPTGDSKTLTRKIR
ncbi:uncharacterized protein RCO7_10502 [Rhynchosporium graminicola]|uniref:Uncharacterized protein n=1 Tax=Rhynchosporium graminicola TaxID=2792576 RepID=A0A1E1LJ49_9HELO|nr:uncharacterized protein RCO7_10502 [Rhynchosporium commune]